VAANLTLSLGPLVEKREIAADLFLPDDASDDDRDWLHERLQPESYLAYLDMMWVTRARPQLVHSPVAIVAAEHDRIFGTREHERLAGTYGVDLDVVPDAAHDLMLGPRWERAAETVATALGRF